MSITIYIEDDLLQAKLPELIYIIKFFHYRAGLEENITLSPLSSLTTGVPEARTVIYARALPEKIPAAQACFIWCNREFWKTYAPPSKSPEFSSFGDYSFPVIFKNPSVESAILLSEQLAIINFDIFAACFFVLARTEEYAEFTADEHQRFPLKHSWLWQAGVVDQPIVDNLMLLLARIWQEFWKIKVSPALIENSKVIINLTFDVDLVRYFNLRRILGAPIIGLMKEKRLTAPPLYLFHALKYLLRKAPDPYWGFPAIKQLQQKLGAPVTYFVIPQKKSLWEDYDLFNDARLQARLAEIIGPEDELALHCTYNCLDTPEDFIKEKNKLAGIFQRSIYGVRHHYLRFKVPESWSAAAAAHLNYDTTFCFAEYEGFRSGTSFPFIPFNLKQREEIPLVEIPLIVMDVTLRFYRRLNISAGRKILQSLLAICQQVNGVLTILWHTSNLQSFGWEKWYDLLYLWLRDSVRQDKINFLSCNQIATAAQQRWHQVTKKITGL